MGLSEAFPKSNFKFESNKWIEVVVISRLRVGNTDSAKEH